MSKVKRICERCGKEFETHESEVRRSGGKYCSRACYYGTRLNCVCETCGKQFEITQSEERRGTKYCSRNCFYIAEKRAWEDPQKRKDRSVFISNLERTNVWRENQSKALKGREITWGDKISESRMGYKVPIPERQARSEFSRGSGNPAYLHGLSPVQLSVRKSIRYRTWRTDVYTRDGFRDQFTGEPINGRGNVHHRIPFSKIWEDNHIKTFSDAMKCEALWDINNGITMKIKTHNQYHKLFDLNCPTIDEGRCREKIFGRRFDRMLW